MEAKKAREFHFQRFQGSSATRATSQGDCEFADPELQPPVYKQLKSLIDGAGTDEEFNRQGGHYRKILHAQQREAFERVFMNVAEARLPKNYFLAIKEEARRIWRGEFSDLVPPDHRHMKKIRNLRKKQARESA